MTQGEWPATGLLLPRQVSNRIGTGEPLTVSKSYALSLSENAALRLDLTAWRGRAFTPAELRGFVLKNILEEWAMLTVARTAGGTGQAHSEITGIAGVPEALSQAGLPPGHREAVQFTISQADLDVFETFPKEVKKRIQGSPEWKAFSKRRSSGALDDEDDYSPGRSNSPTSPGSDNERSGRCRSALQGCCSACCKLQRPCYIASHIPSWADAHANLPTGQGGYAEGRCGP